MTLRAYLCAGCETHVSGDPAAWTDLPGGGRGQLCAGCATEQAYRDATAADYAAPRRWIDPDGKRTRRGRERRDEKP